MARYSLSKPEPIFRRIANFRASRIRIIVIVDASDLSEAAHNDVWKGDRENVRRTSGGADCTYGGGDWPNTRVPNTSEDLQRALCERGNRKNRRRRVKVGLFQNLVDRDPSIAQLLPGGSLVSLPGYIGRLMSGDDGRVAR